MDNEIDMSSWPDEYVAHVDRWLAGTEPLMPISKFFAQKLASALLDRVLAERGLMVA